MGRRKRCDAGDRRPRSPAKKCRRRKNVVTEMAPSGWNFRWNGSWFAARACGAWKCAHCAGHTHLPSRARPRSTCRRARRQARPKHGAEQHIAKARSCSRTCTDAPNTSATMILTEATSATRGEARVALLRARVNPPTGTRRRQSDHNHCYLLRDEANKGVCTCARHGLVIHYSTNTDLARDRSREGASTAVQ